MAEFKSYRSNNHRHRRGAFTEMAPWTPDTDMTGVTITSGDLAAGSPREGDYIARNRFNHAERWLVSAAQFSLSGFVLAGPAEEP